MTAKGAEATVVAVAQKDGGTITNCYATTNEVADNNNKENTKNVQLVLQPVASEGNVLAEGKTTEQITAAVDSAKDEVAGEAITAKLSAEKNEDGKDNLVRIGTKGYSSFEDAIAAANETYEDENGNDVNVSATITLLADVDLTSYPSPATNWDDPEYFDLTNDTLDLNGHKITSNNYGVAYWADGNGCIIKNGTFEAANGGSYGLVLTDSTGTILVENIKTVGGINVHRCEDVVIDNISNTEFAGTNYYAVWAENASKVTIKNGYFSSPSTIGGNVFNCKSECCITILNGNFEAKGTAEMFAANGNYVVCGGTFNKSPSTWVRAGYATNDNKDGTWSVVPTANVNSEGKLISGTYTTKVDKYVADGYVAEANDYNNPTSWTVGKIAYKVTYTTTGVGDLFTGNISEITNANLSDFYINGDKICSGFGTDPEWVCLADDTITIPVFGCTASQAWSKGYIRQSTINNKAIAEAITTSGTVYFVTPEAAQAFATANGTNYTSVN